MRTVSSGANPGSTDSCETMRLPGFSRADRGSNSFKNGPGRNTPQTCQDWRGLLSRWLLGIPMAGAHPHVTVGRGLTEVGEMEQAQERTKVQDRSLARSSLDQPGLVSSHNSQARA